MNDPSTSPEQVWPPTQIPESITPSNCSDALLAAIFERAYVEHGPGADGSLVVVFWPLYIVFKALPDYGGMIRLLVCLPFERTVPLPALFAAANEVNVSPSMARGSVNLEEHSFDLTYYLPLAGGITPAAFMAALHAFYRNCDMLHAKYLPRLLRLGADAEARASVGLPLSPL